MYRCVEVLFGLDGEQAAAGVSQCVAWIGAGTRLGLCILPAVALLLALAVPAMAQKTSGSIWEAPLMKEPFDKTPFRPVKIPAWLENTTTYVFGGAEDAVECKAQMAPLGIGGCDYVYYPSKLLPMHPDFAPDFVQKHCDAFEKAGVRCIAAIPPRIQAAAYAKHPEWRSKHSRNHVPREVGPDNQFGGDLCLMGGWGDYLIDVLVEAQTMYPQIDGFSFDGIHDSGMCYCDDCRAAYKKDTGQDIPDANMNSPEFRRYQHWLDRRMEGFVVKMQNRLKAVNPDCAMVTWTTNAGRFGHFLSIPRNMPTRMNLLFDSPGQEFWLDETNRGNTVVPAFANAYIWAVTNHRHAHSEPYLMSHGNPYGTDSFPAHEMLRRVMLTITHGAQMALSRGWPNLREATKPVFEEANKRAKWLTHKETEPWAAVVMSDNTNCFYGRDPGKVEDRYLSNVLGTFRTALEAHLLVTVINDWNLNAKDLARYKVLVLPNTACISEEQAAGIREFVKNGGGLVASVDTSLFDEFGDPREDFLLADVMGVHYQGVAAGSGKKEDIDPNFAMAVDESYWAKRRSIFDYKPGEHALLSLPRLKEYLGAGLTTFKGQAVAVKPGPNAKVIGTITAREAGAEALPAMVVNQYGKGRVVYLAGGFDSAYYLYPYPYQRLLVAQAMKWAASEPQRVTVEAPMCVQFSTFRQKKDGQRLVVHLYNNVNTAGNHAKPDDDVPLREEVIPIHDIKVKFDGYDISRIRLEPGGVELKAQKQGGSSIVTVPKLFVHSMVVAELK